MGLASIACKSWQDQSGTYHKITSKQWVCGFPSQFLSPGSSAYMSGKSLGSLFQSFHYCVRFQITWNINLRKTVLMDIFVSQWVFVPKIQQAISLGTGAGGRHPNLYTCLPIASNICDEIKFFWGPAQFDGSTLLWGYAYNCSFPEGEALSINV